MDIRDRLLEHNAWMTRQLLDRCRGLTHEQSHRRFDIGPGSLHDTMLHIVDVMCGWADRIADRSRRPSAQGDGRSYTIDDLDEMLEGAEVDLEQATRDARDAGRLEDVLEVTRDGHVYRFTCGTAMTHVLTHGMHHRAQVLNMFRRLGVDCNLDGNVIEWAIACHPVPLTPE